MFEKIAQKLSSLKRETRASFRFKIIFFSVLMLLLTVIISAGLVHTKGRNILKEQIFFDLSAVAKARSDQVVSIIEQDFERASLVASRTQLRRSLINYDKAADILASEQRRDEMIKILKDARDSVPAIKDIDIINLEGTVAASTSADRTGRHDRDQDWFQYGLQDRYQSSFYEEEGHFMHNLALPLVNPEPGKDNIIGVVKTEISLERMMSVLTDRTGLKDTGEIMLVSKIENQFVAMNPLRHQPGTALTPLNSGAGSIEAMRSAIRGESGFLREPDYREVDTLKAYRHVPVEGKNWGLIVKIDAEEAFAPIRMLQNYIILVGCAMLMLGSIALSVNVSRTTAPVRELLTGTKKLGEGDLGHRVDVTSQDELGELTSSFNIMAENLQKITASRNELENEIKERLVVEDKLKEAKEAAEAASKAKSQFLANMSHEIRTPMNVIMGMTDIVYSSGLNEEQKEYLGMVRDSAASLLTIINDILDFSKIEAGRLELESEDFNLYGKVEQTTASFALQAQQKGLELILFIQPDVPQTVRGDPARLRQILVNLLGNAFKFTDEGEIILSLSKEQAGSGEIQDTAAPAQTGSDALQPKQGPSSEVLVFSIQDTGIGIPRNKQALLFQSFSQVDASSTRRHEGTGLGLAISQKLVELMGGSIGVESEPDRGSTFTFRVPLCLPVAAAAEELPAIPEHFPDVHVLVIDDNRANQLIIKEMLESRGLTVQAAPGGREGLEIMRHHATKDEPFDLVFLDQQMPGMDGLQVAEQINREKLLQGPTLIMLSSVDSNVNAARRGALGLFSYLVKPVKPSELFSHIHAALCRTKQQMPLREGEAPVKAAEADQAEQPEAVQGTKLQILLVEDKPMNRKLATTLLNKKGWSVTEAHNGRQALEMLATSSFDLVLMDIQMPEMDGIEATKHIRNQEKTTGTRIPIIAMTAHAMQGDREQFMAAGMDGYVSKPINAEELYRVVEEAAAAIKAEGALEAAADSTSPPSQESEKPADPEAVDLADTGEVEYISREVSSMLKTLGGDKELLAEMVALLLDDAPKDLERLRELLARRDGENATLVAHGLKGQLGNLSLEMGHNTAHSLEKTLFEGQFVEALTCLETLEKELKLLERFFARPDWREML